MKLETGDIVFIKPKGILSWIISKLTKCNYSHVVLIYKELNPQLIMDTDWSYTRLRKLDYYKERGYSIYRIKGGLDTSQKTLIKLWMQKNLDKKYDYIQLFSFLNRIVFKMDKIFNNPDMFVCSEMVDRAFSDIGIDLVDRYELGDVTPDDLIKSPLIEKKII